MTDQLRKCGHPLGSTSWCPDCELQDMRSKPRASPYPRLDNGMTHAEAVQPLRERNMSRVVKGAQALDLPVDDLTNRQRRLLAAVTDLPEPFPTNREHKEGTQLSRHLGALRQRLDWLVRLEEEHGDSQRGVHHSRAERNALIFVLSEQAERAGVEVARPSPPPPGAKYERRYIELVEDMAREAIADGYTVTDIRKPCVLMHQRGEDIAPMDVPVGVWFAVRAYMRGKGSGV